VDEGRPPRENETNERSSVGNPSMPTTFFNAAEMQERLGGIPLERIRMNPQPGTATVDDLLEWQAKCDVTLELVDGTLVEKARGSWEGRLSLILGYLLEAFLEDHDLGLAFPGDGHLRIELDLVRAPDLSFVSWDQLPDRELPDDALWTVYPNLAVEVVSRSNRPGELARKRREYFDAGTSLVWTIDPPSRTATIHTSVDEFVTIDEDGLLEGANVLPGFELRLGDLFDRAARGAKRSS
jgi:Uma2 family endonuclease